jgi:Protein of unknown function (DUF3108)
VNLDPPFKDRGIPDGERTVFKGTIDGKQSGIGVLTIAASDDAYAARIEGTILDDLDLVVEMDFSRARGMVRAEHYRLESRNDGKPVSVEEGWFRDVRGLHWGGELQPYPSNVTPLLGAALAARGLDFVKGERHTFAVWLANSVWWEVSLHVDKRERIELPFGELDAWRVTAAAQFEGIGTALNRIVQAILPPFRVHFAADPPHRFVRFSFPTGPFPWNPRGLIEATELG